MGARGSGRWPRRWVLATVITASSCRSMCIKSPDYNAEQNASDHVFFAPPQAVWEALMRAIPPSACGVWPSVTLDARTIRSTGREYAITSAAGADRTGHRCVVHFRPRGMMSGYRTLVTSHEPWDASMPIDATGSYRPEFTFAVIRALEPGVATAMLHDGQHETDAQTELWGCLPW